ncbi:hypothetical protein FFLO_03591 [Filobasidium floriforme]|uniref:Beta-glucuronidase C-terminal domain-containing protein n=1 Tax=Filobasidium floriforme TaxID=5210 RepID=A0A8K0JKU1_9TREE|nr:hypothetical protein FFLO_03591 [Filobasidium floriforme]
MKYSAISAVPLAVLAAYQANAQVTVYTGIPSRTATADPAEATVDYAGLPAYDPLTLEPPAPPETPVTSYGLTVPSTEDALIAAGRQLSIQQKGSFLGFSIELSVAPSIIGQHANSLKVPFLNYMANIRNRAGHGALVRIGGNTQESSTLYTQGTDDGSMIEKIKEEGASVTSTPTINYSDDLFYAMANISAVVGVDWYFGLPFNQSAVENKIDNIYEVAQTAQAILGERLLGLQMGNEPDLYSDHQKRDPGYGPTQFNDEWISIKDEIRSEGNLKQSQNFLIGPSICCEVEGFLLDDVLNAGFLTDNLDALAIVAVQHYPENNCGIDGKVTNPQDIFASYLTHNSAVGLVGPYIDGTTQVLAAGKDIMMMEFGTASCGGFPGLSDSFGAALWTIDYAMQMATQNFTAALQHVGGQNVYYNAFTPPPNNLASSGYQWTTGSVYYPTIIMAELFGSSNQSQIVDLGADNNNEYHPAYAVYENGVPTRIALINFVSDASGANDLTVTIDMGGQPFPKQTVDVRYFSASSVAEKYEIYWANQTLRTSFASDGRLYGDRETVTINCDTGANTCSIPLKAPSMAIVFLTDQSLASSTSDDTASTATFATSVVNVGSATVDVGAIQSGNGQAGGGNGGNAVLGSNSKGSINAGGRTIPGALSLSTIGMMSLVMGLTAWVGLGA